MFPAGKNETGSLDPCGRQRSQLDQKSALEEMLDVSGR